VPADSRRDYDLLAAAVSAAAEIRMTPNSLSIKIFR
jgi:hypothetical protein